MKRLFSNIKQIIFKNEDVISCKERELYSLLSEETYNKLSRTAHLKQINNIYYFWEYNSGFKNLIYTLKFRKVKNISKIFSNLIQDGFRFVINKEDIDIVIPVPINKNKLRKRGFNQSEIILDDLNINYIKIIRNRNTKEMYKLLDEDLRKDNIKNSFFIPNDLNLDGKNIMLFDDIVTTGSTLREIKKEIETKYNINKLIVLTLAAAKEIKEQNKGI